MARRTKFNNKRRIADPAPSAEALTELARRVRYGGSPYHKRNPGDFGLSPPAQPRPDKTLCDEAGITKLSHAQRLLEQGVRHGMVEIDPGVAYPTHIWAVTEDGIVVEASSTGGVPGEYHGYPLMDADPFRQIVLEQWMRQ